ncbi:ABC transporter substrate-binding protein [Isoptericola variabilis]|uniref:Sulfonate/nitrate/taurine ABC transporter periplasmic protein n=1 Tax=Isoptericola variabilis (strain 225) TaxID=743718 RepID=F6FT87_ISOV2|nr:ABC transporter substrate-binding protein [Isoptericola variabilis]AEG45251.1 sulfonate/nitrate/taurine ABC transporter periplasmic protein [Isoptericola variabilis 225]TWH30952.1 NitT/TauT family transport system substrate-binding protein [Isoptericola variabilis J7]
MRAAQSGLSLVVAGVLVAGCSAGGPAGAGSAEAEGQGAGETTAVTITLNWVPYGEHAPFYYGVEQGIFEEEGIDLTIQPGNGSGNTVQQVAQRNTDFGWADTPPLVNAISSGMPVKSVGVFLQTGPSSVEFFADQGITEPADLVGKTVGGTPGDAMYGTFPAWLELNGVDPADVTVVNVDAAGKIAALIEGKVDAIQGFHHDQAPTIEEQTGKEVEALPFADFGMNLLGTGLVAHDATIAENPELVEAMVRATSRSFLAAAEDPEGAVAAMAAGAEQAPVENVLSAQLETTLGLLNLDGAPAPGANTDQQWTDTLTFLSENTDFEGETTAAEYWDGSFGEGL